MLELKNSGPKTDRLLPAAPARNPEEQKQRRMMVIALVLLLVGALSIPTLHTSREAADRALLVARQILPFAAARPGPPPPPPSQRAIVGGSMEQSRGEDAIAENIVSSDGQLDTNQLPASAPAPMIARTASLSIIAKDFDPVEAAVKGINDRHHGYLGELSTSSPQNAARTLTAALRIPAPQLEAALAELKQLGRVEQESQSGEEVTKQYTDLAARLKNSQETEQRLLNVLRNNTGKVRDILEAEAQIERVRGQIEEMQAEQRALKTRVDFATVQLTITEDFRASLEVAPPSTSSRLHNAVVDGYHAVVESLIGLAVWLLSTAPILLLWAALLFFPVRWAWKRWLRPRFAKPSAA